MEKICFIDLETTGLDKDKNGVIQIAGRLQVEGEFVETFNFDVQPFTNDDISDQALAVNGKTLNDLMGFEKPQAVHRQFTALLGKHVDNFDRRDKFHFCGYNSQGFDMPFTRKWFEKCGDKYFGSLFWSASIDVMPIWAFILRKERHKMKNFKLATVAKHAGIEVDPDRLHDAMYDIDLTIELYNIGIERLEG